MPGRHAIRASAAAAAALALAGCSLTGNGAAGPTDVSLLVTNGFGAQTLLSTARPQVAGAKTVLRMLERTTRVATLDGGRTVERVDGVSAPRGSGWYFFENGVGHESPATTRLRNGDHIWWDLHDGAAAPQVPAVVGAFPEPFTNGYNGKHVPLRIECVGVSGSMCNAVQKVFARMGIVAFEGCFLCSSDFNQALRVVVGTWSKLGLDHAADLLGDGPAESGVYARFKDGGRTLALFDEAGHVVRTVGAGAGLIAATRYEHQPPAWYLTGTDPAGVAAAVAAFNRDTLEGHFALAIVAGAAIPLPDTTR